MKRILVIAALSASYLSAQTTLVQGGRVFAAPINYCTEQSAPGNAFTCADPSGATISALVKGMEMSFQASHANTGATTLSVDGLLAPLRKPGAVELIANDIKAGSIISVAYDGTQWQMLGGGVSASTASTSSNPTLARFFNALSASSNSPQNVLVIGDSETRCWGNTCGSIGPTYQNSLWVEKLRAYLSFRFGSHGSGIIPIQSQIYGGGTVDGHNWTLTGTYVNIVDMGPYSSSVGSLYRFSQNASAALSGQYCDRFRIYYASGADTGTGFDVSIDGAATANYGTETSGPATAHYVEVAAGAAGNHTLTISKKGTGYMHLYGVEPVLGTAGISVHNIAEGACTADCWADNASHAAYGFSDEIPGGVQLVIVVLDTNEIDSSTPVNTYTANLQKIVTHFQQQANPPSVIFMDGPWISNNQANAPQYFSAMSQVANANNIPFFDTANDLFTSYATEQTNGYIQSDGLHLNDNAQQAWGAYAIPKLFGPSEGVVNYNPTTSATFNGGNITQQVKVTVNNGTNFESVTPVSTEYSHYGATNDIGDRFSWGIGGSQSPVAAAQNNWFLYNWATTQFVTTINQSGQLRQTNGNAGQAFIAQNTLKTDYSGVQLNADGTQWMTTAGNSQSPYPGHWLAFDLTSGVGPRIDIAPNSGTGNLNGSWNLNSPATSQTSSTDSINNQLRTTNGNIQFYVNGNGVGMNDIQNNADLWYYDKSAKHLQLVYAQVKGDTSKTCQASEDGVLAYTTGNTSGTASHLYVCATNGTTYSYRQIF